MDGMVDRWCVRTDKQTGNGPTMLTNTTDTTTNQYTWTWDMVHDAFLCVLKFGMNNQQ